MLRPLRLATDAELVERARGGADDAVGELMRRHRAALVRHCTGIAGADAAEDAVQHAFLRAVVAIRGPEGGPQEVRPWLFRVAGNAAIDALRAHARHGGPVGEDAGVAEAPGDVLERRNALRDVIREVRRLPERQREALLLRAVEGRSYDEIATELDASEGTVRQLIFRARERMRAATAALVTPGWVLRGLGKAGAGASATAGGGAVKAASLAATAGVFLGGGAVAHHIAASGGEAKAAAPTRSVAIAAPPAREQARLAAETTPRRHRRHAVATRHPARHVADSPVRHAPRAVPAPAPAQPRPAPSTPAPRPAPDPTPEPEPTAKPAPAPHTPTGPTTTTATPAPTPAAAAPAPAAAAPEPAPAGPAAPPAAGEITVYSQSPGFGGPLSIRRANGEVVNSYFGEHAVLNCYRVRPDGTVASHETCGRDRLVAGTTIALAEHAPNASGSDVWTHVELIVPA